MVVVLENQRQLQILESELGFFCDAAFDSAQAMPVFAFPSWECLPYDMFSPHHDITSRRLRILSQLPNLKAAIILTTCDNLMQRLPPLEYVLGHSFSLQKQQQINPETLRTRLVNANYIAVQQVMSPGEFAFRGGLVDIFPMGSEAPFRIDLFDNDIETIRYFDPDTQRSSQQIEQISLLPAREFPMTDQGVQQFRQAFRQQFEGDPRAQKIYSEISNRNIPAGAEFFFPLFFDKTSTLFDYIKDDALWLFDEQLAQTATTYWAEIEDRYTNANYDSERKVLPAEMLYLNPDILKQQFEKQRRIIHCRMHADSSSDSTSDANSNSNSNSNSVGTTLAKTDWHAPTNINPQLPVDPREQSPYRDLLNHINNSTDRLLIAVETAGRREALESVLLSHQVKSTSCENLTAFVEDTAMTLGICVYPLERGLFLPEHRIQIIAESQLYGEKVFHKRHGTKAQDPESIIRSLAELQEGAPVVHREHGVGRYRGLQFLEVDGQQTEFLALEYQAGDKLYVPILALNLISRFVGGSPEHAPLHRLGGEQWQKTKNRARKKAYDVATELLEIEALRSARDGVAFKVSEQDYQNFISRFPFEETEDQQTVIDQVRADLESPRPMDRLVCGDVGFGKTEVAMRAAFIVVHNNCQAAILVPTTLLAQQHYQNFVDRFADLSITVEVLSRFKTKKQATEVIQRLKQGSIDIVIGTHRLLQKDIGFKKLGLLIIDEEHRFGVRQKEKIKRMRSQVDLLTLTATPIPRTLNITMSGLRSISFIATAPQFRLSIKTFIRESAQGLIREACLREIRRGGQVYFLYNDVRTMERFAEDLAELLPEAEINFGHGQMSEAKLERVMQDFYHKRFNVLVCSTIIESGIDIPSVNTIIIHRADKFGLAQLHQLRGRVGRSHHQAFAYLLIPGWELISSDARKRLHAFELMEDLGAGFALASHDLEIRGAGELLGETQSGLIDDVGFSLYSEYLNMAITSIRDDQMPALDEAAKPSAAQNISASVDLHIAALFPEDYLANPHARLIMYKRIASATDQNELQELQIEAIDRFGLLPQSGKNLFHLTALRLQSEKLGIQKIDIGEQGGSIEFIESPAIDPSTILELVEKNPHQYRIAPSTLKVTQDLLDPQIRLTQVEKLLDELAAGLPEQ